MTLRTVLHFPDPRLRQKAAPVSVFDDALQILIDDMLETMYAEYGIGLAATQINVQQRVVVIDLSDSKDQPMCLINPEIISSSGTEQMDEGCLSVPGGIYEKVTRAAEVSIRFLDRHGQSQSLDASGLLATCIQHEIDHLNGKLFIDYLSSLKRDRIEKKLKKLQKHTL